MKVVHVVQRFAPETGGAETHVRAVAAEQARRGHDVVVATSLPPGAPEEETLVERGARIHVRRFPARRFRGDYLFPPWLPMRGLVDFLAAERPDLYHAHSYRFATIEAAAEASRRSRRPFIATAHGFYPPENALVALSRRRYDRARGGPALRAAARCIAVTKHEVAHYEALGVEGSRVDVAPNGIDEEAFAPGQGAAFRAKHRIGSGPLVVFLARLAHDKGLGDLVRAAPRILARTPDATIAVCGADAGAGASANRLAQKLGVGERVRFVGRVPDPRDAYAATDVFALPSHYEAFGIVFLEAMAQGAPVIGTSAGGMPEVIGHAGLVVPPRDPAALADAVARLLADAGARKAMGDRGRARAREFLWPRVVDLLEESYGRALAA